MIEQFVNLSHVQSMERTLEAVTFDGLSLSNMDAHPITGEVKPGHRYLLAKLDDPNDRKGPARFILTFYEVMVNFHNDYDLPMVEGINIWGDAYGDIFAAEIIIRNERTDHKQMTSLFYGPFDGASPAYESMESMLESMAGAWNIRMKDRYTTHGIFA